MNKDDLTPPPAGVMAMRMTSIIRQVRLLAVARGEYSLADQLEKFSDAVYEEIAKDPDMGIPPLDVYKYRLETLENLAHAMAVAHKYGKNRTMKQIAHLAELVSESSGSGQG